MNRSVVTVILALGAVACRGEAERVVREMPPAEQALAGGTRVTASIQDSLTSRSNKKGDTLRAITSVDVKGPHGGVVIPAGSAATLAVAELESSDASSPDGRLVLVVSTVTVDGADYPIAAALEPVPHHLEARVTATNEAAGSRVARRDVVVSAGTPIVFTLTHSLKVSAR
jgi:hypothetical protein